PVRDRGARQQHQLPRPAARRRADPLRARPVARRRPRVLGGQLVPAAACSGLPDDGRAPRTGHALPCRANPPGGKMIEVTNLTKTYGSTRAVSDLSFHVKPGQVTGFLGHNGAGKSTTMRMILGLHRPDSGRALINGVPKRDLPHPMREVGAMLDAAEVQGGRSAFDHLRALAYAGGLPRRRVVQVLEEVGLAGAARKRIAGFSQGMRQRLGIAAALLGDPGVLILDEPVNGLDPDGIRWLRGLLRS